LVLTNDAHY